MDRLGSIVAAGAVGVLALIAPAQSTYSLVGSFAAPAGLWTVGADGRVWALDGATVRRQTAINSSTYEVVGTLDAPGGRLSISPDGTRLVTTQGNTLRAASVAGLSTSTITATTSTTLTGTTGPNSVGAWSGNLFFIGASGRIASEDYSGVFRLDFGSGLAPTSALVLRLPGISTAPASGPVAIGGGNLFWATRYFGGSDPDALLRFPLAAVSTGTSDGTSGSFFIAGSTFTATGLAVDGFGTAILDAGLEGLSRVTMTAYNPISAQLLQTWMQPGSSVPPGSLTATHFAMPVYNPVTFELLAIAPNGSISRFSIPSPGAMGVLGFGALAAGRRRR